MGVAALIIAMVGLIFALAPPIIPYPVFQSFGQIIGTALGLVALGLGVVGRRFGRAAGQSTRSATASIAVGATAAVLGVVVFTSCLYCWEVVGQQVKQGGGAMHARFKQAFVKEFGRELNDRGKPEYRRAVEQAVRLGQQRVSAPAKTKIKKQKTKNKK